MPGGASLGAVQVGMLQALSERQIQPDLLVGTSAGAVNAAYVAGHGMSPEDIGALGSIWRSLRTWKLFRPDPLRATRALLGYADAFFSDRGLREAIEPHLTFTDIENAATPLIIVATDLMAGTEVALDRGPAVEAILASSAIPGVLPPVHWGDRTLVDGGLANNTAISTAVHAGADTVYVLSCGYPCALPGPPRTTMNAVAHTMALLVHQRVIGDILAYADSVELIVIPPPCPQTINPMNFGHAAELIARGHRTAVEFLDVNGGRRDDPAANISMHTHG